MKLRIFTQNHRKTVMQIKFHCLLCELNFAIAKYPQNKCQGPDGRMAEWNGPMDHFLMSSFFWHTKKHQYFYNIECQTTK
jgi:hypothetical protein